MPAATALVPWRSPWRRCRLPLAAALAAAAAAVVLDAASLGACAWAFLEPRSSSPPRTDGDKVLEAGSRRGALLSVASAVALAFEGRARAEDVAAPAPAAAASGDPLDRLVLESADQLAQMLGLSGNSTGGDLGLPAVDPTTGTILLALGGFALVVFPILKFLVTGAVGLYVLRFADQRFSSASKGGKPGKAVRRLVERLSGVPPDPLEARLLKVVRLNDELAAMRTSMVQQEAGAAAGKVIKEAFKRERRLAAWNGALRALDLTEKEREEVGKVFARFSKKELARREEVTEQRASWLKGALGPAAGGWYDRWRLGLAMERQLSLEAKLLDGLREAKLPAEKLAALAGQLAESEDPLWLTDVTADGGGRCVYVLTFGGDGSASRVRQLQQEISAVLATRPRPSEVVLVLNSPGGTVTGYGLAAAQLMRLRHHGVRLVACVDEVAASGGYLMACCADRILASPFAAIGSIGVISGIPNAAERLSREGIRVIETTAGKWKRTITPFREPTEEDLAKAKADLGVLYQQFSDFVKANRPAVDLDVVATGEVWFGPNALARGLVDELMTSSEYLLSCVRDRGCEVLSLSLSDRGAGGLASLLPGVFEGEGDTAADAAADVLQGLQAGLSPLTGAAGTGWPPGSPEPRFQADVPFSGDLLL